MATAFVEWVLHGNEGVPNFCADHHLEQPSTFLPEKHKKYHAKYCFVDQDIPQHIVQAPRTTEGFLAYNEFLIGLEKINQQEFVMPGKSGAKLEMSFKDKNAMLNQLTASGLAELAAWERQIRQRAETRNVMKFTENLLRRSRMDTGKRFEECSLEGIPIRRETYTLLTRPPEKDWTLVGMIILVATALNLLWAVYVQVMTLTKVCSGPFFCPDRAEAAKYPLAAPPAAFRIQGDSSIALMAPTVEAFAYPWDPYLQDSKGQGYLVEWPYYQKHAGRLSSNGQTNAGYTEAQISELDGLGAQTFLMEEHIVDRTPQAVAQCKLHTASSNPSKLPYVWDPFAKALREEYLECESDETLFTLTNQFGIPAGSSGISDTSTGVTFSKKKYDERHEKTVECMQSLQAKCRVIDGERDTKFCADNCGDISVNGEVKFLNCDVHKWWKALKATSKTTNSANLQYLQGEIETCVNKHFSATDSTCDCHEKEWTHFPLPFFYQGADTNRLKVCDSGADKNQLCTTDATCKQPTQKTVSEDGAQSARCILKYPDAEKVSRNINYGCFFSSPTSYVELGFSFKKCNFRDSDGTVRSSGGELTRDQAQGLLDVQLSKRTALVGIFLFKELGIVSGFIVVCAICMFLGVIVAVLSPLILVVYFVVLANKEDNNLGMRITVVQTTIMIYNIVYGNIEVLATMATNLSTCYRAFALITQVLRATVNKSLRDMDKKLTNVSNVIYNLILLLIIEDQSPGGADSAAGLVASLAGTLASLLFQLVSEKCQLQALAMPLKDLNENRLSKFETALLWCKILEDFLQEDVQYNWVQIFNSKRPLMPDVENHPQFKVDGIGVDETGSCDAGHLDGMLINHVSADKEKRMQYYMPALDAKLAAKFGHDGMGLSFDPKYNPKITEQTKLKQSVYLHEDGLIRFVHGFSEAAVIMGKAREDKIDTREFDKLTHDDAPVMAQANEAVGGEPSTTIAEIFYGTEHPHEYNSAEGKRSDLVTRKASGITSGMSRLGDIDSYVESTDNGTRSRPRMQRSAAPPPPQPDTQRPSAPAPRAPSPPPPTSHLGGSWEDVLRERNYLSSHMQQNGGATRRSRSPPQADRHMDELRVVANNHHEPFQFPTQGYAYDIQPGVGYREAQTISNRNHSITIDMPQNLGPSMWQGGRMRY